jgi:DNA-directed RNA polymerase subunit RPC12/RpoP
MSHHTCRNCNATFTMPYAPVRCPACGHRLAAVRYRDSGERGDFKRAPSSNGAIHPIIPVILILGVVIGAIAYFRNDSPAPEPGRAPQRDPPTAGAVAAPPQYTGVRPREQELDSPPGAPSPSQSAARPGSFALDSAPIVGAPGIAPGVINDTSGGAYVPAPIRGPTDARPNVRTLPKTDPRMRKMNMSPPMTSRN